MRLKPAMEWPPTKPQQENKYNTDDPPITIEASALRGGLSNMAPGTFNPKYQNKKRRSRCRSPEAAKHHTGAPTHA